jgi:pimeloyl-ACP methyl ester carboxylesterase
MAEVSSARRTVDGLRAGYLTAGSGQPLLLLHGGTWGDRAQASWGPVLPLLAARRRVIAPDWLGFGGSDLVRDFAAPEDRMVGQVRALLDDLGIATPLDVVALSMGGSLLLRDLTGPDPRLPARRVVLVSAGGAPMAPDVRQRLWSYDGTVEGMRALVALTHHDHRFAADDAYVARWHAWSTEPGGYEHFAALAVRRPGAPPPPPPALDRLTMPVLVCAGAHDRLKEPGWGEDLAARLPAGRATIFHHSGHCPQIEEPEAFAARVLQFLDEGDR